MPTARKVVIPTKTYFILDDNIGDVLGGVKIGERGGKRVVTMTDAQAAFYLTQGAIGEKEADDKQKAILNQMFGRKLDDSVNDKFASAAKANQERKQKMRAKKHETESDEANRTTAMAERRTTPVDPRPKGLPTTAAQQAKKD